MHFLQFVDCLERLTYLIRFGHAPDGLDIHQRPALPGHPIKEVAASLPRFPEVVVADSSEVIEPDVPRVSAHICDGFVHVFMMALMQSIVKNGAGR